MNIPGMAPQMAGMYEQYGIGQLPNPFFTVANQFVPRNFHDVIKWSRYITTQAPTTTEVIRKLSSYPITDFVIDTKQEKTRASYRKIIDSIRLKYKLTDIGFDYYTLGNVITSIYFPVDRYVECPHCKSSYEAKNALTKGFVKFKRYEFVGECPRCAMKGSFTRIDKKSMDISRINLVKWKPENIAINHNPITDEADYYYTIPGDVKRKIMTGDPLFISSVPWPFVEAVKSNTDFLFDRSNVYHLKTISMGGMIDGMGVPPLISQYGLVFYQAMLRKANEAVASEHMTPLRVMFPQQSSGQGDPVAMMSMRNFADQMKQNIRHFKKDPNHVIIAPVPVGYQNLGGQGKSLLVSQELQFAEETMLMSMGVSRELLSGTTNWTSSTVGLRLLENTMNNYVGQIEDFIAWVMEKISQYLGLEIVPISLVPFKLTDNENLKQLMLEMWKAQLISTSTFLEASGIEYSEELEKMRKDAVAKVESDVQVEHELKIAKFMKSKDVNSENQDDNGFQQNQQQAYQIANKILNQMTDPVEQRAALTQLQQSDPTLYNSVLEIIQQMLNDHSMVAQGMPEEEEEGEGAPAPKPESKKPEPKKPAAEKKLAPKKSGDKE